MGRRKIEIKAIKDDRNRSVTFLKRKGGLFKKAHELSVLCSVDVAVIIFGSNKKLYEYSSSDIGEIINRTQFYGGANEHKGPADFNGKKDLDDDDEDDMGTPPQEHNPQMMPPQYQHPSNQFQHIRHQTSSASPPIPNGVPFHHPQQRQHTPQPHQISRPASRNDGPRRVSSNLSHHGMPQVSGPPPGVNGFAYMPNPSIYNPNASPMPPGMPQHQHQQPPPPQQQQQQPSFQYPAPPPPQHLQQVYMEDARRQSMPPAFPQVERAASIPHGSPPQPQQSQVPQHIQQQQQQQQQQPQPQPQSQPQPPQPKQEQPKQENRQQMLEPIKKASKSRSIFTPIDEDRSVLSKHWASSTTAAETSKIEPPANRSQSVDVAAVARNGNGAIAPPPSPPKTAQSQAHKKDRNISLSSIDFQPPSRTNSGMSQMGPNAKRPRLKVQIPDEPSDNDSQTAESNNSAQGTNSSHPSRPNAGTDSSQSGGPGSTMGIMTLPPPSPSTSTIQSAGATGPPNPFARPLPPSNTNSSNSNSNQPNQNSINGNSNGVRGSSGGGLAEIETPVSALPSRFMNNEFLPSPSSFYPEWNFRAGKGGDSAGGMGMEIQSPLNFATPVVGSGPSFLRDDGARDKEAGLGLGVKRKSPDGEGEGSVVRDEAKRVKHEA